eukprot:1252093-Pleurochrysis_carterae.AAC.1
MPRTCRSLFRAFREARRERVRRHVERAGCLTACGLASRMVLASLMVADAAAVSTLQAAGSVGAHVCFTLPLARWRVQVL